MDVQELMRLIGLLVYFGLVKVNRFDQYWSVKTLYHGLWARRFMPRKRFQALMARLHVVDPGTEERADKLRKVCGLLDKFTARCKELYQPFQNVSVDERMVKSKGRSGIKQYLSTSKTNQPSGA